MATRGPKTKTLLNSRKGPSGSIVHGCLDPPCDLTDDAKVEYERLLDVLRSAGTLERVDLLCVANAARVKALVDKAHKALDDDMDPTRVKLLNLLTTQLRGLMRELALTLQPSRTTFRAKPPADGEAASKWTGKLRLG
jgi:hypothetical protein